MRQAGVEHQQPVHHGWRRAGWNAATAAAASACAADRAVEALDADDRSTMALVLQGAVEKVRWTCGQHVVLQRAVDNMWRCSVR